MKTNTTARMLLAAGLIIAAQALFAQATPEKKDDQKYRLHIVRNNDGKKEVIDMAFASKGEMEDYLKQKNIDVQDELALPALEDKAMDKDKKGKGKKDKKIIIIEKDESGLNKDIDLEIGLSAFTEDERLELIQQLLNIKGGKVHIIQITKTAPAGKGESSNESTGSGGPQPPSTGIGSVKEG